MDGTLMGKREMCSGVWWGNLKETATKAYCWMGGKYYNGF
jgi:hypothetical protein